MKISHLLYISLLIIVLTIIGAFEVGNAKDKFTQGARWNVAHGVNHGIR